MKKLFKIIGVAACALAAATIVNAQPTPSYAYQTIGGIPATMTNGLYVFTNYNLNVMPLIDCRKAQNVAFAFASSQSGSSISNTTYVFYRSVDGINWDTNSADNITFKWAGLAGLAPVNTTNINVQGFGWLGLATISNATLLTWTNNLAQYSVKLGAP